MTDTQKKQWNTLPGPDNVTVDALSNGIKIFIRPNPNSPSVILSGYIPSGSLFDPSDKLGLARFTALSLMRGTQKQTFHDLYDSLESVGANMGFGTSIHNVSFGSRALVEDLPLLLNTLKECLCEPAFPNDQIEKLRTQLLTGLAIRAQDTAEMAALVFDKLLFNNHPYGRPEDGHPETIQTITRDDIIEFHRKHYGPKDMVLVIVGDVDPHHSIELVKSVFENWENPQQVLPPELPSTTPLEDTIRQHINIPGKYQTDLIVGTLGPKRNADDYISTMLGNNILGQFGMMGRIGGVVREQAGLAYHASTSLNASINAGSWEVMAGVNPTNLEKAIDLIISELRKFISEPVTFEELNDSQSNVIGRLPLSLESNAGVASALLNIERFNLGLDYYYRFTNLVKEVTPDMILASANKYLNPEKLCIVSSGPQNS